MKHSITPRLNFLILFAILLVTAASCSKDENEGRINTEIFFEADFGNGFSATSYGPLFFGKRPENIGSTGITANEIIDANGEVFTTLFVFIKPEEHYPQRISLGKISAVLRLIKPGKGIEGDFVTYYDSLGVQFNISAPNNINSYLVDGSGFTINKTGTSSLSGSYAEGSYTYFGKHRDEPGLEKTISGKFRLYLYK